MLSCQCHVDFSDVLSVSCFKEASFCALTFAEHNLQFAHLFSKMFRWTHLNSIKSKLFYFSLFILCTNKADPPREVLLSGTSTFRCTNKRVTTVCVLCLCRLTCRHKKDPCAENNVVAWLVELTGSYTQASHEEQDDAENGEDTGRSNSTWTGHRPWRGNKGEEEKERKGN